MWNKGKGTGSPKNTKVHSLRGNTKVHSLRGSPKPRDERKVETALETFLKPTVHHTQS